MYDLDEVEYNQLIKQVRIMGSIESVFIDIDLNNLSQDEKEILYDTGKYNGNYTLYFFVNLHKEKKVGLIEATGRIEEYLTLKTC